MSVWSELLRKASHVLLVKLHHCPASLLAIHLEVLWLLIPRLLSLVEITCRCVAFWPSLFDLLMDKQFFHQVGGESASTLAIPNYISAVICMTSPASAMQMENAFQIASEHGSIISPGARQKSWVCSLPGSITYNTL